MNDMLRLPLWGGGLLSAAIGFSLVAFVFCPLPAALEAADESKPAGAKLDAVSFTASGELLRPANRDEWVFLGA